MAYWLSALVFLAAVAGDYLWRVAPVGTGYTAKILCSAVFVSGREPEGVREDLASPSGGILRLFSSHLDRENRRVLSHFLGTNRAWAVYRPGLGCALAFSAADADRIAAIPGVEPRPRRSPWPVADKRPALETAVRRGFEDPGTRAVVVVKDGRIAAESYAEGFGPDTPLLGWSMTKSVANALVGIRLAKLVPSGEAGRLFPEWKDERAAITVRNLLRMRSGLRFREVYAAGPSDVTKMLFTRADASGFAAAMPLERAPGSHYSYSSGTTNLLMRYLRDSFASDSEYHAFARRALFDRIGAGGAVLETDGFGTFVGSSFMYASARDWARLGELYRLGGVWRGERVLPEGWVAASLEPAGGGYGAHLWVDLPADVGGPEEPGWADGFYFLGHEGQSVSVVPSRGLVVVRLGLNRSGSWNQKVFLSRIIESLAL
jgi:CubicO group peptidase (beta-lactamase class C family)